MATGEQISFKPTFAEVLAQDFHYAAVDAEVDVDVFKAPHPFLSADLVDRLKTVRCSLIRTEETKILVSEVQLHHVPQKHPENARGFGFDVAWYRHAHGVIVKIWHRQ